MHACMEKIFQEQYNYYACVVMQPGKLAVRMRTAWKAFAIGYSSYSIYGLNSLGKIARVRGPKYI